MQKEKIAFKRITNKGFICERVEYQDHFIEIDPSKSSVVQILEYCWNNLPHGFKPSFM